MAYKDLTGITTKNGVKILRPVGVDDKTKCQIWEGICPICGKKFQKISKEIVRVRSCGCQQGAGGGHGQHTRKSKGQKLYEANMEAVAKTLAHYLLDD